MTPEREDVLNPSYKRWKVTAPLKNILLTIPKYLYTSIVSLVGTSPEISTVTKVSFQTDFIARTGQKPTSAIPEV